MGTHLECAYEGCDRARGNNKKYCPHHHAMIQQQNNPIAYHYNIAVQNAKRFGRRISFSLEEFRNAINDGRMMGLSDYALPEEMSLLVKLVMLEEAVL